MKSAIVLAASLVLNASAIGAAPASKSPSAQQPRPVENKPATALAPASSDGAVSDADEVEELRELVRLLKSENAELRRKLDELAGPTANNRAAKPAAVPAVKPVRKNYTRIEIGMTREDVDSFIRRNKNLRIVGVSADAGVRRQQEEVTVRRQGTTGTTTVRRGGPANSQALGAGTVDDAQQAVNAEHTEVVDRKITSGRQEIITVAQMVSERVVTGQKRNSLGGSAPVYGNRTREGGRLRITLIDDVVTAVDGSQY